MFDVVIANNLVLQDTGLLIFEDSQSGFEYKNNLWSGREIPMSASSPGDVIGDPMLLNPNGILEPGEISIEWYKISGGSPAIGAGLPVAELFGDFFGNERDDPPDIGAFEYSGTMRESGYLAGDLDGDGDVDLDDYEQLVADFGKSGSVGFISSDIDLDGNVTIYDYNALVGNFSMSHPTPASPIPTP